MISAAKLEANRRNAQRSTGPSSAEGKAIASRNSLKHGLYASNPLLDGENPQEFAAFRDGLLEALAPADAIQQVLTDRAIVVAWKLRRVGDIEDAVINHFRPGWNSDAETHTPAQRLANFFAGTLDGLQMNHLSQYEQRLQRSLHAALRQLKQLQKGEERGQGSEIRGQGNAENKASAPVSLSSSLSPDPCPLTPSSDGIEPTDSRSPLPASQIESGEIKSGQFDVKNCGDCPETARFDDSNAPPPNSRAGGLPKSSKIAPRTGFAQASSAVDGGVNCLTDGLRRL